MLQRPPVAPWAFEVVGPLIWLAFAGYFLASGLKRRRVSIVALVFIGGTTMWWQEWFADWGAYVLYNPHLHLMGWWRHSTWTSPNKPWAVIPAYGWFYSLVYFPLVVGARKLAGRHPRLRSWQLVVLIGLPVYYLWDLLIEGVASQLGLWSYVRYVGPAISGTRGNFPLVYPIIPFVAMMTITAAMINARHGEESPWIEHLAGVDRTKGVGRTVRRFGAWILGMNACYLMFVVPTVLVRIIALPANSYVP